MRTPIKPTLDSSQARLKKALANFARAELQAGATAVLGTLGYSSERVQSLGEVEDFLHNAGAAEKLTERQHGCLKNWRNLAMIFQITHDEIRPQRDSPGTFDNGRDKSFLFIAVELESQEHRRAELADATRAVNRLFAMPTLLLFRHKGCATLSVIHRRAHRRDESRTVLEKVSLIKDIDLENPHRAHLDILAELSLPSLLANSDIDNFHALHAAWEGVLDLRELNQAFFDTLSEWCEIAIEKTIFPDDGQGDGSDSDQRHIIRLVTRMLFIWFLREKGLVPAKFFEEEFAKQHLKNHSRDNNEYYCAVLQNLFFATLNTEIDKRRFSKENSSTHRDPNLYRYPDFLQEPNQFKNMMREIPFINGGLFDCLDDFEGEKKGGKRIDVFTDWKPHRQQLKVPASLFFDEKYGLFPRLEKYKFTVEESTPLDVEVALDPELLGMVFERLLAAQNPEPQKSTRKTTGSFYTPRAIVSYMVDESLKAHFNNLPPPPPPPPNFGSEANLGTSA